MKVNHAHEQVEKGLAERMEIAENRITELLTKVDELEKNKDPKTMEVNTNGLSKSEEGN